MILSKQKKMDGFIVKMKLREIEIVESKRPPKILQAKENKPNLKVKSIQKEIDSKVAVKKCIKAW